MKLSTKLRTYKHQLRAILSSNDLPLNTLITLSALGVSSGLIWFYGPLLTIGNLTPLAQADKRGYAIAALFLIWLIKFLNVDLAFPNTWYHKDPEVRRRLNSLIKRFRGAMQFINNTSITHQNKAVSLQTLPWYILVGPANAGKTALLAHSRMPFILQRQFTPSAPERFDPSENCDWWLTRDGGIIDVPSHYLFGSNNPNQNKSRIHQLLWSFFLALIKKQGENKKIIGIAIAIPLADIIKQDDTKSLDAITATITQRIRDIEKELRKRLPCTIILTKCDLIAGFNEFFAESSEDELTQAWGITLPNLNNTDEIEQQVTKHFNALIKKLNQQLLWRLHHERNPMARPPIKDFPLQMEKIKGYILDLIKKINKGPQRCNIQGLYLTSALQPRIVPETSIIDGALNHDQRALQVFQDPTVKSRAYFIKQLITDGLFPSQEAALTPAPYRRGWKQYFIYAASVSAIILAGTLLGRDFRLGLEKTRYIESNLMDYRNVLQQFHNPNESMTKTLTLLQTLQKATLADETKSSLTKILTYYSDKSQHNAVVVYHHALQAFLMPEIRNYLADYLETPINKDAESVYSVLKAYLMLGDMSHFDPGYVRLILSSILPDGFTQTQALLRHFDAAVADYQPLALNQVRITETRQYLLSLRGIQLGYIILKSINSNTQNSGVLLGDNAQASLLFNNGKNAKPITVMFTGRNFMTVFEREIQIAAQEATTGNWILGNDFRASANPTYAAELMEELRAEYVKNYADTWETAIENIHIETPHDLQQADAMITSMTSYDSPLVKLLNIIYENTYFQPVTTASAKLQTLGQLVDKNSPSKADLYELLANLQALHDYLQPVLSAEDPRKAAYQLITDRMQHQGTPDPITKLRMAADQSPMPVKAWINQLSNDTWHFLLKNAMRYMDTSWAEKVVKPYQTQMADRYPFTAEASDEVSLKQFTHFFGKPGIITSFYSTYLMPFIDTTKPEWAWKKLDDNELPLAPKVPQQIQQAMSIHHVFFPNGDDNLYVPFALQQHHVSKNIDRIKLNINNKVIVDQRAKSSSPYVLAWPYNVDGKYSSIELTVNGKQPIETDYPGTWGWFKLVHHAYESSRSNKEIILNFSKDKSPAQYLLSTQTKQNPFTSLDLNHFTLTPQLTTIAT
jgi:type VI secretion system protein ImpL